MTTMTTCWLAFLGLGGSLPQREATCSGCNSTPVMEFWRSFGRFSWGDFFWGVHPPCADFAMVFVMFCSPIPKQGDFFEDIGRILKSKWKFWMDFFCGFLMKGRIEHDAQKYKDLKPTSKGLDLSGAKIWDFCKSPPVGKDRTARIAREYQ